MLISMAMNSECVGRRLTPTENIRSVVVQKGTHWSAMTGENFRNLSNSYDGNGINFIPVRNCHQLFATFVSFAMKHWTELVGFSPSSSFQWIDLLFVHGAALSSLPGLKSYTMSCAIRRKADYVGRINKIGENGLLHVNVLIRIWTDSIHSPLASSPRPAHQGCQIWRHVFSLETFGILWRCLKSGTTWRRHLTGLSCGMVG